MIMFEMLLGILTECSRHCWYRGNPDLLKKAAKDKTLVALIFANKYRMIDSEKA